MNKQKPVAAQATGCGGHDRGSFGSEIGVTHRSECLVAIGGIDHVAVAWSADDELPHRFPQGVFKQEGAEVGHGSAFLF